MRTTLTHSLTRELKPLPQEWCEDGKGFLRKHKFRCAEEGGKFNFHWTHRGQRQDRCWQGFELSSTTVVPRAQLPLCTQAAPCIHTNTDVACMLRVPCGYRERIIFTHTPRPWKTPPWKCHRLDNRDASISLWGCAWTRSMWRDFYSIEKVSPAFLDYYIYRERWLALVISFRGVHVCCFGGLVVEEVKKFSFFSFDEWRRFFRLRNNN